MRCQPSVGGVCRATGMSYHEGTPGLALVALTRAQLLGSVRSREQPPGAPSPAYPVTWSASLMSRKE